MNKRDSTLWLADPALRWCLDSDQPDFELRATRWLERMHRFQATDNLLTIEGGDQRAMAWLSWTPDDEPSEAEVTALQDKFEQLIADLTAIAGDEAVDRFLSYAEAVDGLLPDVPCHCLSAIAATSPAAVAELVHAARAQANATRGSAGLFAETADDTLADALLAAGGQPGGQAWTASVAVRSFWWPSQAEGEPS
ncbi:MAG: hypothetical protein KC502_05360 [Myxococcales bacterium]|nr:hypothetical protein [Myxococcales bacterium]